MNGLPDMLFIIDVRKEDIAVKEANRLGIPIVAVVDTNCSPEGITQVIPGNDDALRAIRLFASRISDAILEGRQVATEGSAVGSADDEQTGDGGQTDELTIPTADSNTFGDDSKPAAGAAEVDGAFGSGTTEVKSEIADHSEGSRKEAPVSTEGADVIEEEKNEATAS